MNSPRIAELRINKNDETVGIYAYAYLDAAARIFEHGTDDFAPYPGMYCLRHGLELFVKQVTVFMAYEMREKELLYEKGHGLMDLWQRVKQHVEDTCSQGSIGSDGLSPESFAALDELIEELHEVDPRGGLFRYPEDIAKGVRFDTHFPGDRMNLTDWQWIASETLATCQTIIYELEVRCSQIQGSWEEWGPSLYDIVAKMPGTIDS